MGGFLGGLIGPALTQATNAAGAYEGASAQANNTQRQAIIQNLIFQREQQKANIENALKSAQTGESFAKTALTQHQAQAPVLGDPGYASAMGQVAGAESAAKLPADLQMAITHGTIDYQTGAALAKIRGQIEGGLQGQKQTFEQGQQARELAGQNANRLSGIAATQSGEVLPSIVHAVKKIPGAAHDAFVGGSGGATTQAPSPAQSLWDQAVALHGEGTVLSQYGPRPTQ